MIGADHEMERVAPLIGPFPFGLKVAPWLGDSGFQQFVRVAVPVANQFVGED
ncbi:hypothetical protein D3C81_2019340 [compost metagenome]